MHIKNSFAAKEHLAKDEKMKILIDTVEPYQLVERDNIFIRLCSSIMSQQLSIKVADVIFKRFLNLYNGSEPQPYQILETPIETLRGIGLSYAKANYVHNVAAFMIEKNADDALIRNRTNEEIIEFLTQIKGVGRWSVEMLLMFTLGREDVFALDDLGIQQTMIKLYNLNATDKKILKKEMQQVAENWKPYRTYACFYLWKFKDNKQ